MAKNEDFSVDAPAKTARLAIGGIMAPSDKIGLLVRYEVGRKEEAINTLFDTFGKSNGVTVVVPACGLSRSFATPDSFPRNSTFVPGKEGQGLMFVKYEVIN